MSDTDQPKDLAESVFKHFENKHKENSEFNEYFNGDEPIKIPSPRKDVDPYIYERSEILFWVAREAYEEEKIAWENKKNQERHKETIGLIGQYKTSTPFRELLDVVKRGRVVPFIGAGLSKSVGMPLWGDALKDVLGQVAGIDAPSILKLIDQKRFLDAAQLIAEHDPVQMANYIKTTFRINKLKLEGPLLLLPRFAQGCVVTTNFDDAIEETYKNSKLSFDAYMYGKQDYNFFSRLTRGDRCLLKLHGDADTDATHILTKAQYADAYGTPFDFKKPLSKALRQIFVSNSLLFLGCGLEQDWTLDLFKSAKDQNEYEIPKHYALVPAPVNPVDLRQKSSRLLSLNIQPIWYPDGRHDFIEKYLQLIVDVFEKRITFNG